MEAELVQQQVQTELMKQQLKVLQDQSSSPVNGRSTALDMDVRRMPSADAENKRAVRPGSTVYRGSTSPAVSSQTVSKNKARDSEFVVQLKLTDDDDDEEEVEMVPVKKTAKSRGVKFADKIESIEMDTIAESKASPVMNGKVPSPPASPPRLRKSSPQPSGKKTANSANRASMPVPPTSSASVPQRSISVTTSKPSEEKPKVNGDVISNSVATSQSKSTAEELGTVREIRKGRVKWPPDNPDEEKEKKKQVTIGKIVIDEKPDEADGSGNVKFSKENQEKVANMLKAVRENPDGKPILVCYCYNVTLIIKYLCTF